MKGIPAIALLLLLFSPEAFGEVIKPVVSCESLGERLSNHEAVSTVTSEMQDDNVVCRLRARWNRPSMGNTTVWLPTTTWTGRYVQIGWSPLLPNEEAPAMLPSFVSAQTKTDIAVLPENVGERAQWRLDFAHLAQHATSEWVQRTVIPMFYDRAKPTFSYFVGDADALAGRQAVVASQRYPHDFDGILAGAPAVYFTTMLLQNSINNISDSVRTLTARAVLEECDERDGIQDGILRDPRTCDFDPVVLRCDDDDEVATCLTESQVRDVQDVYAGPHDGNLALTVGGAMRGSEPFWQNQPSVQAIAQLVSDDTTPVSTKSYFDTVIRPWHGLYGAGSSSSSSMASKLLVFHGWSDPFNSPLSSVALYQQVLKHHEEQTRLYMIPACARVTDSNNMLTALMQWVEEGTKPSAISVHNQTVQPFRDEAPSKFQPAAMEWIGQDLLEQPLLDCEATDKGLVCNHPQTTSVATPKRRLRRRR